MKTSKILIAGFVGGIVALLLGFLIYGLALESFFAENVGSATGVMKEEGDFSWPAMVLGHIAYGMLFAVVYGRWASITTFATGAKAGAVLGFLVGSAVNLIYYGSSNIMNLTSALADIVVMTVTGAIVGGVVAIVLDRLKKQK
ncbi:MAG TPA: hypothetical protein VJ953_18250 [Saprospiraceae bacterium]|nr:hypothetical protein [Saprospiraceae bacterium]